MYNVNYNFNKALGQYYPILEPIRVDARALKQLDGYGVTKLGNEKGFVTQSFDSALPLLSVESLLEGFAHLNALLVAE